MMAHVANLSMIFFMLGVAYATTNETARTIVMIQIPISIAIGVFFEIRRIRK